MLSYILRRILATLPVMAIVALFVFSLLYIAPGDPAAVIAGDQASPADVERIRQGLGLDRPFLIQFGSWVWRILHGDLGTSIFTNLPVGTMIAQRMGPTLSLMIVTLLLTLVVAVPLGVIAAWKAGSWIDRTIMAFAVFGFSLPVFVVGYILAYVFALQLNGSFKLHPDARRLAVLGGLVNEFAGCCSGLWICATGVAFDHHGRRITNQPILRCGPGCLNKCVLP